MKPATFSKKNPCICKMLEANLGHVTENDDKLLADAVDENNDDNPVCAFRKAGYGYFVYVPESGVITTHDPASYEELLEYGYSKEFVELMKVATKNDCGWINLDCDGTELEDLPKFSW